MTSRCIIVTADDFGYDADTCAATEALLIAGKIRSATIMTGMPGTDRAIAFAKSNRLDASFGLHFNIAEGMAQHQPAGRSLIAPNGEFRGAISQRLRCLFGVAHAKDIALELECQLAVLFDSGVQVSHVDSHGHLHKFPAVAAAMQPIMQRFGLHKIRRPQNIHQRARPLTRILNKYCESRFPAYRSTDHLAAIEIASDRDFDNLIRTLPPGTTELAIHPGSVEPWRRTEATLISERLPGLLQKHRLSNVSFDAI